MPVIISQYIRWREGKAIEVPGRNVSPALARQHVEQFGETPLAFPALADPQLHTFGDDRGMITYGRKMGYVFALGDPVAPSGNVKALAQEFIDAFGDPVFVACTRGTAEALSDMGYLVNAFGHDTAIDLGSFSFAGGTQKRLRYSESWLKRRGAIVTETPGREVPRSELAAISSAWRGTRIAVREIAFLNRPLSVVPPSEVRRFFAVTESGEILGFNDFDPIYRAGTCVGYLASGKRRIPEDTAYLDLAIMAQAIRTFQAEGLERLHLGISPLAGITQTDVGKESRALRRLFQISYDSKWANTRIFNFQGLVEYKGRFRGTTDPLYVCMPKSGSNIMRMVGLGILTKIV